jgi:hypothetical protein
MIAYDGSAHADAALGDLRRAGLPREAEALLVSVAVSAQCSVWVARRGAEKEEGAPPRIIIGADGSAGATWACLPQLSQSAWSVMGGAPANNPLDAELRIGPSATPREQLYPSRSTCPSSINTRAS